MFSNLSTSNRRKNRSLSAIKNINNKTKALSSDERSRELKEWRNSWFSWGTKKKYGQ